MFKTMIFVQNTKKLNKNIKKKIGLARSFLKA